MRELVLKTGDVALIDEKHFDRLSKFRWLVTNNKFNKYVRRKVTKIIKNFVETEQGKVCITKKEYKDIPLANEVMQRYDCVYDHIDRNTFNNQENNLRICSSLENTRNRNNFCGSTSKYKGVSWSRVMKKWRAVVVSNNKYYHIGYFTDEQSAAIAYNNKAVELHSKFAVLNQINK